MLREAVAQAESLAARTGQAASVYCRRDPIDPARDVWYVRGRRETPPAGAVRVRIVWPEPDPEDGQREHGPRCAQRFHGAAECTCGAADEALDVDGAGR